MTRVRYERVPTDYLHGSDIWPWYNRWIERPRLIASATALALGDPVSVLDPACGDGSVILKAYRINPTIREAWFSDIAPAVIELLLPKQMPFDVHKQVGDVFTVLRSAPHVNAIVLTEILEHLEDPDALLRLARKKADWIVASSPIVPEGEEDHTEQHLWSFDLDGYRTMLEEARWVPKVWLTAACEGHPYGSGFQVWGCSAI